MKPELVIPAGNREKLETAFLYGADAVYAAGRSFGLRAHAGNFTLEELEDAIKYTHAIGKRIYITVNIFANNEDLGPAVDYLKQLNQWGVDGIMITDPGLIRIARTQCPDLPLCLSTQANCTNAEAVRFWQDQGLTRVVLARELSLNDIRIIKTETDMELEVFIHGGICVSWSGRCFISRYLTGRDANQGDCTHSCRWEYALMEPGRKGEYMPVEEDDRGTYFFNHRDLCLLDYIPGLMEAGIDALKVEGRMKSVSYVATTTAVYRDVIDTYADDPQAAPKQVWMDELLKTANRRLTAGFIRGTDLPEDYEPESNITPAAIRFCGVVRGRSDDGLIIDARNQFKTGETLEFFMPGMKITSITAPNLHSKREGGITDVINTNDVCTMPCDQDIPEGTIIRRIINQ